MKLMINIPDDVYEDIEYGKGDYINSLNWAVRNGTPISSEDDLISEKRPQGEWIHYLGCGVGKAVCSECGQVGETKKYCGNCGADMRPEKKLQTPSCLTNPERQAELLERYKEE